MQSIHWRRQRAFGAIVLGALACGPTSKPRDPTPIVRDEPRKPPARERIDVPPIEIDVQVPHPPSMVFVPSTPPFDGPPATATLATDRAAARELTALAKQRLSAIEEVRKAHQVAMRERAALDKSAPDAEQRMENIQNTRQQRVDRANARRLQASAKLLALLAKHDAKRTLDGAIVRAMLLYDAAEDELERKLTELEAGGGAFTGEPMKVDASAARDAIDNAFARFATADKHHDARYARAWIHFQDDSRTGALLLVQFVRDFPSSKFVEGSYLQIGHTLFGDPDPLAKAGVLEAFRWLADKATTLEARHIAQLRLGLLHDRAREWPQSIAQHCRIVDDPKVDVSIREDAMLFVGRAITRGGIDPLRSACASQTCPCTERVLDTTIRHMRTLEDDVPLREVVELARTRFPSAQAAAQWSCDLVAIAERHPADRTASRGERDRHASEHPNTPCATPSKRAEVATDVELVSDHVATSGAIKYCIELALEDGRASVPGKVLVEFSIAETGIADAIDIQTATNLDVEGTQCIRSWIGRHRWTDLGNTTIAMTLVYDR